MNYQIFNEDCLEGMKKIADGSVDMILTDLPFNLTDCAWDKSAIDLAAMWAEFKRILKPYCSAVLFASGKFTHKLVASNWDWYKYKWIWVKNAPTMFVHAKNAPMRRFEEILVFSDGVINHKTVSTRRMKYNPQGLVDCDESKKIDYSEKPSQLRAGGRGEKWIHNIDKVSAVSLQSGKLKGNSKRDVHSEVTCWGGKLKGNLQRGKDKFGDRPSRPYIKTGEYATKTQIHNPHPENFYIQEQTGYPSDVLNFNAEPNGKRFHPTQKPTDLLEYLIKTYTDEGETVLDATMGSGSTGVACVNTNRNFIGFELEENFFEIAEKRIAEAVAKREQSLF